MPLFHRINEPKAPLNMMNWLKRGGGDPNVAEMAFSPELLAYAPVGSKSVSDYLASMNPPEPVVSTQEVVRSPRGEGPELVVEEIESEATISDRTIHASDCAEEIGRSSVSLTADGKEEEELEAQSVDLVDSVLKNLWGDEVIHTLTTIPQPVYAQTLTIHSSPSQQGDVSTFHGDFTRSLSPSHLEIGGIEKETALPLVSTSIDALGLHQQVGSPV